jgi:hypothetical protein
MHARTWATPYCSPTEVWGPDYWCRCWNGAGTAVRLAAVCVYTCACLCVCVCCMGDGDWDLRDRFETVRAECTTVSNPYFFFAGGPMSHLLGPRASQYFIYRETQNMSLICVAVLRSEKHEIEIDLIDTGSAEGRRLLDTERALGIPSQSLSINNYISE